jgi:hypothetical protein
MKGWLQLNELLPELGRDCFSIEMRHALRWVKGVLLLHALHIFLNERRRSSQE